MPEKRKTKLRSDQWFNNPKNPDMTALYLEKYMNYGLKRKDLQSGKPIIGIAPVSYTHLTLPTKRIV